MGGFRVMLALLPARGGSKGLPGKNIKLLNGKPLIAYSIEAAKNSAFIDRIVVSTDDKKIAEVSEKHGAKVPFLRPQELANDYSKAIDNYLFSIPKYEEFFTEKFQDFVVLQPTSPLRNSGDIDEAISIFNKNKADSVISLCKAGHPPVWAKILDENNRIRNYFNESIENRNRQEIPQAYMPNGAVFVFKYNLLRKKYTYYSSDTYAHIMPEIRSIDIDSELDFLFAEFVLNRYY